MKQWQCFSGENRTAMAIELGLELEFEFEGILADKAIISQRMQLALGVN